MDKILIGSQYFFSCYEDFNSGDIDEIIITDDAKCRHMVQRTGQGHCLFTLRRQRSTGAYIAWALQSRIGMVIGKFLVPEFNEAIGFTIKDLPRLAPLLDRLDEKHEYERIIYDSYIENNSFTLTPEQRLAAYESYKNSRGGA